MNTRNKTLSALAGHDGSPLISNEKLHAIYAAMLKCRMLTGQNRKLGAGREASIVGTILALCPHDSVSPAAGELTPYLVKGVPLRTILARLNSESDVLPARDTVRRVIAPGADFTAQMISALRVARLNRKAKNSSAVAIFCECAQIARGAGLQFLRSAAAERLPVLFVCHAKASKKAFAPKAQDYGLPGFAVDGEDAVAVYRVASEATAHARRGNGPTLIECRPWPAGGQKKTGTGNALRNMETYLSRKGLFSAKLKADLTAQFRRDLDKAAPR